MNQAGTASGPRPPPTHPTAQPTRTAVPASPPPDGGQISNAAAHPTADTDGGPPHSPHPTAHSGHGRRPTPTPHRSSPQPDLRTSELPPPRRRIIRRRRIRRIQLQQQAPGKFIAFSESFMRLKGLFC